jgi:hypothetical protein
MSRYLSLCGRGLLRAALAAVAFAIPAAAQDVAPATNAEPAAADAVASAAPVAAPAPPAAPAHPWITPAAAPAADTNDDGDWHGSVALYGFLSSINGELRARDRVVEIDRSFGDITDVLKFAAAGRVEVQHGPWGFAFDDSYVHVGDDVTTDRALVPDFRFDLALNIAEFEPSYRIYSSGAQDEPVRGPKVAVDVIGGVRVIHINEDLEVRRLIRDDVFQDQTATYVHGYLGNKFTVSPSKYFSFVGRYNIALASDFSWFINGTGYVQPWEHVSFGAGLQVLDLSLENDSKDAALDSRFFGPVLYVRLHF